MSTAAAHQAPVRVGNLPPDPTSFIGRRRELAEVKRLLSESRLVTLTGVGGVGKTRIALRVAAGLHRAFADRVWLVDLTKLSNPSLLAQTVAETLQINEPSRRDPMAILVDYLGDRQLLLVLDNCEHLLQECAVLAETLLEEAPGLRILATSRQALNVPNEHTMSVPPLPLPDSGLPAGAEMSDQNGAVALFVERASAVQHGDSTAFLSPSSWRRLGCVPSRPNRSLRASTTATDCSPPVRVAYLHGTRHCRR
jgi:non-specific serine/threonine protein kinase